MQIRKFNPWDYPEGMEQGVMISGFSRLVFVSGQCAVAADGSSLHPGDMGAQVQGALDNVATVLAEAGLSLANIVRMNTYVTDMEAFLAAAAESMSQRLAMYDVSPPGVLAGVVELGRKDLLVEIKNLAIHRAVKAGGGLGAKGEAVADFGTEIIGHQSGAKLCAVSQRRPDHLTRKMQDAGHLDMLRER